MPCHIPLLASALACCSAPPGLACTPGLNSHSGIGGVILLSVGALCSSMTGGASPCFFSLVLSKLAWWLSGLRPAGKLPLRMRFSDCMLSHRGSTWPAFGAATTTVLGETAGGGFCESDRNRGWMCSSWMELVGVRSRSLSEPELQLRLVRTERGGSRSHGVLGLGLRLVDGLAGIVSRQRDLSGGVDISSTCRLCASTEEVSHESNEPSALLLQGVESRDGVRRCSLADSLASDELERMTLDSEAPKRPLVPVVRLVEADSFDAISRVWMPMGLVWLYRTDLTRKLGIL